MPLIKCPDCGQQVSSTARACPLCGYDVAKSIKYRSRRQGCAAGALLIAVVFIVVAVSSQRETATPPTAQQASADRAPKKVISGSILPFYVDQASAIALPKGTSGQIVVAVNSGQQGDWAATAAALAKEAVNYVDYVKVEVLKQNPAGYGPPLDLKELAVAYYGPDKRSSPWPDDPFKIFLAEHVATEQDIVFEKEYNEQLERLANGKTIPDNADEIAMDYVRRKHRQPKWELPYANMGGKEIVGSAIEINGEFSQGIDRVRRCLGDRANWSFSCK